MSLIKWNNDELFPSNSFFRNDFFDKDFFGRGIDLGTSVPAVNITEEDKEYDIEVAIPGGKKEDINLDIDGNFLTISSEKEEEKEEKEGKKVTRREFNYSSFSRSFKLPENVDGEKIKANFKEGILNVRLPKRKATEVAHKKRIAVD